MRKLIIGLFGLAAIVFGALAGQPAMAQPYYPGYRFHDRPPAVHPVRHGYRHGRFRHPRRVYRPYRAYRHYRPAFVGPRCFVRPRTVWNGYRWVRRPVRVCRY